MEAVELYIARGDELLRKRKLIEAALQYRQALRVSPQASDAYAGLGAIWLLARNFPLAIKYYKNALDVRPDYAEAHCNLGSALCAAGQCIDAIRSFYRAIELDRNYVDGFKGLGMALTQAGQFDRALESYLRALELNPCHTPTKIMLGTLYMLLGDFEKGLPYYEARYEFREERSRPQWKGEDIRGKRMLVRSEQGLGDSIQLSRYVPLLAERGAQVVLQVPAALKELFTGLRGVEHLIQDGEEHGTICCECHLMSLPLLFRTTINTIPSNVPYLDLPRSRVLKWQKRVSECNTLKIGVAWGGRPQNQLDRYRSIALEQLASIASIPNISLVSLQKGPAAAQLGQVSWGKKVIDFGAECKDLVDTAALITALDLVISVDTCVAHLAGALGVPVWILLGSAPDWRWLLNREDSPWYPTARLFRQSYRGEWSHVVASIAKEVETLCAGIR